MEKVLVTGATGFLGKYITEQLIEDGYQVLALGRKEEAGRVLEEFGAVFCKAEICLKKKSKFSLARFT